MTTLSIPDMTCGHCQASVEAALSQLSAQVQVDLPARLVRINGDVDQSAVLAALNAVGFPAKFVAD